MQEERGRDEDQIRRSSAAGLWRSFEGRGFGDVMVVGGGISGVQASLDLAASGFKVYLVDKAPAIGGHMAQLDKTFPTNDCSI
jgi:heterodisulfide reductase subunit A2